MTQKRTTSLPKDQLLNSFVPKAWQVSDIILTALPFPLIEYINKKYQKLDKGFNDGFPKRHLFQPQLVLFFDDVSYAKTKIRSSTFTHESARIIRVLDTFSMVNFVLPPFPAIRPMALER